MKRIISITIALCLIFASVLPVYAEAWTAYEAQSVTTDVHALITAFTGSVGTMYNSISEFLSWMTPVGSFSTSHSVTEVTLYEILDYIAWSLSGDGPNVYETLQDIASSITNTESFISSWMGNNNNYLSQLVGSAPLNSGNGLLKSLTNYLYIRNNYSNSLADIYQSAHRGLGFGSDSNSGLYNLLYGINIVNSDGSITSNATNWNWGTPIGNIAWILKQGFLSLSNLGNGILLNAKDNLTTWEHSTNTQTAFTPTSLANGLFRYLAYIQSDTGQGFYKLFYNMPTSFSRYKNQFSDGSYTTATTNINSFAQGLFNIFSDNYNSLHALNASYYLGSLSLTGSNLNTYNQSYRSTDQLIGYGFSNLSLPLKRLAFVLANDEEIAARNAAKDDQNAVVNNFVASSGNGSASPTDYATVSAASSDFQSNFDTGVSASGVWSAFSNNYEWFTQTTADNLDTSQNNTRSARYETPYLDNYYSEVMGFFENKRSDIKESPDYVSTFIEQFNAEREQPIKEEQR